MAVISLHIHSPRDYTGHVCQGTGNLRGILGSAYYHGVCQDPHPATTGTASAATSAGSDASTAGVGFGRDDALDAALEDELELLDSCDDSDSLDRLDDDVSSLGGSARRLARGILARTTFGFCLGGILTVSATSKSKSEAPLRFRTV